MAAPSLMAMPTSAADRRVVDAVADHDDRAPRCTLGFDKTRLVLRQYLGAVIVHTDLSRNGRCGARAVAGQHDRAFDAQTAQPFKCCAGLIA